MDTPTQKMIATVELIGDDIRAKIEELEERAQRMDEIKAVLVEEHAREIAIQHGVA